MSSKLKKIDAIIIVALLIIAGAVLIKVGYVEPPIVPITPEIEFYRDDAEKILRVVNVDSEIYWSDIKIYGDNFDKGFLGAQVVVGDEITNCEGTITIYYKPNNDFLGSWTFTPKKKLPESITTPNERTVKPEDEGEHYKDLLVNREWWYYTAVFSKDSELPGWTLSVSFNYMSRTDILFTKPDMMFVVLTSPEGDRYSGVIEKDRPLLGSYAFLKDPVLQVTSSDKGFRVSFEDSFVQGKWPNWHLHVETNNVENGHKLLIDLQFFAPASPIWLHNNRPIDGSKAKIASYAFVGCDVSGSVEIDGFDYDVKGIGHHEHTWATGGILTKTLIRGWDWSHIKMENGWNVYYSNYYFTSQIKTSKDSKINPLGIVIVTNDQGKKITMLEDVNIKIERSDDLSLLLKIPIETIVTATPSLKQIILSGYNIKLDLNINAENTFDHSWKKLTQVGMKIGSISTTGVISWSDDYGDHEVKLDGIGTIWNMRH